MKARGLPNAASIALALALWVAQGRGAPPPAEAVMVPPHLPDTQAVSRELTSHQDGVRRFDRGVSAVLGALEATAFFGSEAMAGKTWSEMIRRARSDEEMAKRLA